MVTNKEFSKIFGCSVEDVDKAIEVLESFVDTHPVADIDALRKLFIAEGDNYD